MTSRPAQRNDHDRQADTVLAICGSLRRDSFNRQLLECAAAVAPPGIDVGLFDGLQAIPPFNEDLESDAGYTRPVEELRARVRAASCVMIATPEYNRSIPGHLKNVIDWLSRPAPDEVLAGKPVVIVGATSGPWGTRLSQSALRQVLHATEAQVMPGSELFVRDAGKTIGRRDDPIDAATVGKLERIMAKVPRWLEQTRVAATRDAAD